MNSSVVIRCIKYAGEVYVSRDSLVLFLHKIKDLCNNKYTFFTEEIIHEIEKIAETKEVKS